ncbi:P-loop containing nucleoside triphosphate hydrolase protein, partial [Dimargaris cristalligena]
LPVHLRAYIYIDILGINIMLEPRFRILFGFRYFNSVQTDCFDQLLHGSNNVVISAPTGAGKTCLLELALIQLFRNPSHDFKAIYLAPTKALCAERFKDWSSKFDPLGISCKEATGDTDFTNLGDILRARLIIATPEKWDALSRRWRDNTNLMKMIKLLLIDEVHMLREKRGATLEAVISRMRVVEPTIRYLAVSATVPNISDIAAWLSYNCPNESATNGSDASKPAIIKNFGEEYRPVKLVRHVYGVEMRTDNYFLFERNLDYKLPEIVSTHSHGKPTLVFCSTRKSAQQATEFLSKTFPRLPNLEHLSIVGRNQVTYDHNVCILPNLELVVTGVAFHHAGLDLSDRRLVENLFIEGMVKVICTTSTLAVGVNLPAHLVVIKSTRAYINSRYVEYSDLEILQMIGRAGRPQFDTSGVAVILTTVDQKSRYDNLVSGQEPVESSLHLNLIEHINAEISLGSIANRDMAIRWLKSTFLYTRICNNPSYYKIADQEITSTTPRNLPDIFIRNLHLLEKAGLVRINPDQNITSNEMGKAMARYYIKFPTVQEVAKITSGAGIRDILITLARSDEFKDLRFQAGEKTVLNTINKYPSIRHPLKGKVKTIDEKVFLLLQVCGPDGYFVLLFFYEQVVESNSNST